MGDVSDHFDRAEFACKCGCGFDVVDIALLGYLEDARHYFDKPIIINDACRCATRNLKVGGSPNSQHLLGKAADIRVLDMPSDAVASYFEMLFPDKHGVGRYKNFTHFDIRVNKARWDYRNQVGANS